MRVAPELNEIAERTRQLIEDQRIEGKRIRFADLVAEGEALMEHREFIRCDFIGPAILLATGCDFFQCTLPAKPQGYWQPTGARKIGVFALFACKFERCTFNHHIAIVLDSESGEYKQIADL